MHSIWFIQYDYVQYIKILYFNDYVLYIFIFYIYVLYIYILYLNDYAQYIYGNQLFSYTLLDKIYWHYFTLSSNLNIIRDGEYSTMKFSMQWPDNVGNKLSGNDIVQML